MSWLSQAIRGDWSGLGKSVSRSADTIGNIAGSVATGNFGGAAIAATGLIQGTGNVGKGFFAGGIPAKPGEIGPYDTLEASMAAVPQPETPQKTLQQVATTSPLISSPASAVPAFPVFSPVNPIVNQGNLETWEKSFADVVEQVFRPVISKAGELAGQSLAAGARPELDKSTDNLKAWILGGFGLLAVVLLLRK